MSAESEYQQRRRAERRELLERGADVEHGSASTYNNWFCRCEPCRAAKSLDNARTRQLRKEQAS